MKNLLILFVIVFPLVSYGAQNFVKKEANQKTATQQDPGRPFALPDFKQVEKLHRSAGWKMTESCTLSSGRVVNSSDPEYEDCLQQAETSASLQREHPGQAQVNPAPGQNVTVHFGQHFGH